MKAMHKMKIPFSLFCALAFLLVSCATVERTWHGIVGGQNPLVGKIWGVREKRFVSQTELVRNLQDVDYILLGEKHDNPDHHELQAEVIRAIARTGKKPKVAFEQLSVDQKEKVAAFSELHPETAEGLGDAVGWKQAGWPDYKIYQPIFQAAMDAKFAIVPVNLSASEKQAVQSKGLEGIDDNLFRELDLERKLPPSVMSMFTEEIRASHCYKIGDEAVPRFIEMQRARDAVMAQRTEAAAKQDGAILIVGAGHARNEWGIPVYLRRMNKLAKISTVAFMEVRKEYTKADIYVDGEYPYDYIWFTPSVDEEDPCAKFKDQLEKVEAKTKADAGKSGKADEAAPKKEAKPAIKAAAKKSSKKKK